jgi:hypothetical protein
MTEEFVATLTLTDGLMARLIAMGIWALIIVAVFGGASRLFARRITRSRPRLQKIDPYLGGLMGLVEGSIVAVMLLWAPLVLEPVARAQLGEGTASAVNPPSQVAKAVVGIAERVHKSPLGPLVAQTNPVQGSDLLSLAADFAAVSRDPDAMRFLMDSEVMRKIEDLPSVKEAVETLRADTELVSLFNEEGVSKKTVNTALNSRLVLNLFDRTTIVRDMAPLGPELAVAIREAKARADVNAGRTAGTTEQ